MAKIRWAIEIVVEIAMGKLGWVLGDLGVWQLSSYSSPAAACMDSFRGGVHLKGRAHHVS